MVSVQEFTAFKSLIEQQFTQANEITIKSKNDLQTKLDNASTVFQTNANELQAKLDRAEKLWGEADVSVTSRMEAFEVRVAYLESSVTELGQMKLTVDEMEASNFNEQLQLLHGNLMAQVSKKAPTVLIELSSCSISLAVFK